VGALEYIEAADCSAVFSAAMDCVTRRQPFCLQITLRTARGGRKRVLLSGEPVQAADGTATVSGFLAVLGAAPDVQAAQAAELDELIAQLRDWELFGHAIPHELGTPLATIEGFSAALGAGGEPLSDRGRHQLGRIAAAARRMDGLLQAILQFTRLAALPLEPQDVDLSGIAHEVFAALREADPERDVLTLVAPRLRVRGDPGLLRLAVGNLLSNAWKFTRNTPQAQVRFHAEQQDTQAVFCVSDNGPGFPMDEAPRLFLPFQRLHAREHFDGSGIGLVLVRRAIERHGGSVWAQSARGQGACFCFALP
jgi:signal transduction histidine kinase